MGAEMITPEHVRAVMKARMFGAHAGFAITHTDIQRFLCGKLRYARPWGLSPTWGKAILQEVMRRATER